MATTSPSTNAVLAPAAPRAALLRRPGADLSCRPRLLHRDRRRQLSLALSVRLADRISRRQSLALRSSIAALHKSHLYLPCWRSSRCGGFYLQARDAAQPSMVANLQPFATGQDEVRGDRATSFAKAWCATAATAAGRNRWMSRAERIAARRSRAGRGRRHSPDHLQQADGRGGGPRSRRRVAAARLHLWRAPALHRQAAHAAQLPKSRRHGHGRLSRIAGHSSDRFGTRQQRRGAARIRGQPHRAVAQRVRDAACWRTSCSSGRASAAH